MRNFRVFILPMTFLMFAGGAHAQAPFPTVAYAPDVQGRDLDPSALELYSSSRALTAHTVDELRVLVGADETEALARPSFLRSREAAVSDGGAGTGGSKYLPVLFSALVPGLGEIYLGYKWRGAALVAVEVAAWTGYFYYRNEGLDTREAYEAFADANWDQRKWIDHHPDVYDVPGVTLEQLEQIGRDKAGSQEWPGYIPWTSKEADKQHYYENIGKYDWFISGWSDYDPEFTDPDTQLQMHDTELRDQYRAMRKDSNDKLDTSNTFVYVSLGARVFSIVETLFLVRGSGGEQDVGLSSPAVNEPTQNYLRIRTRPRGVDGAEVSVEYNFK